MNILSTIYSEKSSSFKNHCHNYHQIMYIVAGEINITIDGREYSANENSLVILSCFEQHSINVIGNEYKRYVIEISPKLFAPVLVNRPENFSNIINAGDYKKEIENIFESIITEHNKNDRFCEKLLDLELEKLFIYIERLLKVEEASGKSTQIIYNIQKEFEKNYKDDFSLEKLSEKYHISRYHLSRLFKKTTGYAPVEYLIECRMSAAKRYLSATELSVQEIVEKCGFSDESNFCRKFKEKNKVSPTTFRKKYKL